MIDQDLSENKDSVENGACGLNMFFKCMLKWVFELVFLDLLNTLTNLGFVFN